VEQEIQTITLSPAVVDDLKKTAWQVDLSVPDLLSLIILEETYKHSAGTREELDIQVKEGWEQLRETILHKPHHIAGRRRRKIREEIPSEDGHWFPTADGLLTLSLPISKFQSDRLREMARTRGISAVEEVARVLQEAVKGDYKPRSEEEWVKQQNTMMRELWQKWREILRHIWSTGGKRR
jgi:hypothetical protein